MIVQSWLIAAVLIHPASNERPSCKPLWNAFSAVFTCELAVHNSFAEPWNQFTLQDVENAKQTQCAKVRSAQEDTRRRFYAANSKRIRHQFPAFRLDSANDQDWFQIIQSREVCVGIK